MIKLCLFLAAITAAAATLAAPNYAAQIVSYDPGTGFAAGFTNPTAALGEPSRANPFGEPTDPFNPPYGTNQVVSIGAGGSITVKFHKPVYNRPRNPFRLDFIIFGNAGFIITNDFDLETFSWIGEPTTDGSLFGATEAVTRVSVSRNGRRFFPLDSATAAHIDHLFPMDHAGDFSVPVDPALTQMDFAGLTLDAIRDLYGGSGGGAGFNLGSARNRIGRRVALPVIRFVRIEVLEGKVEIDALSAVAPRRRRP